MKSIVAIALCATLLIGGVVGAQQVVAKATDADTTASVSSLTGLASAESVSRPVAVSVNSTSVRSVGVSSASVLYEVLAQGSETSWTLVFDDLNAMPTTGPVDQANDTLWQFVMPQNAILVQNGWNIYAQNLLNCYAYQPVDAQIEGTTAFVHDNGGDVTLPSEDCWFISSPEVQQVIEGYGISTEGDTAALFSFGENTTAQAAANGIWIQYASSTGTFLSYDTETARFVMNTADNGTQVDADTGEAVAFDNVFVLYAASSIKDDGYTREYDLSEGTGLYLTNGTWQSITWYKGDVTDSLILLDATGEQLVVNPGTSYIGIYGGFSGQKINLTTPDGDYDDSILVAQASE